MTVYIVVLSAPYEGEEILAAFDSEEGADRYIEEQKDFSFYLKIREQEVRSK